MMKISLSHRYQIAIWFRSFNGNLYICRTCSRQLQKGKVLCQAVSNKLKVFDLPSMQKLEKVLIAKCLLFKKSLLCQVARCQKYLEQYVMCQLILWKLLTSDHILQIAMG